MAISLKTAGTWARIVADPSTVTIPGTPAAGDRMFLFVTWKTYTITIATPSGWTDLGEFADGAVAAGNGTGSVKVQCFYRDWQSGDANPSIDWSASPTEGHAVIMLWQKGAGDTWDAPVVRTGGIAAADPFTVDASSTVTIPNNSVVMGLVGLRDDSTTIARNTDAIDDTGALVTWNGNYVESPAAHFSSTTGNDMSGDLGHRLVTTGAAGVTLHMDGDPAAAETGSAMFLVQGLVTNVTVTPGTATLTTTLYTPGTVLGTIVIPGTASLSITGYIPSIVLGTVVKPSVASLTANLLTPTTAISNNISVTPGLATLTLTTFIATVSLSDNKTVIPGTISTTLTTYIPTLTVSNNIVVGPGTTALLLTAYGPLRISSEYFAETLLVKILALDTKIVNLEKKTAAKFTI